MTESMLEDTDEPGEAVFKRLHAYEPGPGQPGRPRLTHADFMRYVQPKPNGCWAWTGPTNSEGQPVFGKVYARLWIWENYLGKSKSYLTTRGLWLGRSCGWMDCVSPLHIEAMTPSAVRLRRERPRLSRARPKPVIDAARTRREGKPPSNAAQTEPSEEREDSCQ